MRQNVQLSRHSTDELDFHGWSIICICTSRLISVAVLQARQIAGARPQAKHAGHVMAGSRGILCRRHGRCVQRLRGPTCSNVAQAFDNAHARGDAPEDCVLAVQPRCWGECHKELPNTSSTWGTCKGVDCTPGTLTFKKQSHRSGAALAKSKVCTPENHLCEGLS